MGITSTENIDTTVSLPVTWGITSTANIDTTVSLPVTHMGNHTDRKQ